MFKRSNWTEATRSNGSETPYQLTKAATLHDWEHCAPAFSRCKDQISPCTHTHTHAYTQCRMQDRLCRSDLAGCVTVASNAWAEMAMTPDCCLWRRGLSLWSCHGHWWSANDCAFGLGQIGWAAARFCCKWASKQSQNWWRWGQNVPHTCIPPNFPALYLRCVSMRFSVLLNSILF